MKIVREHIYEAFSEKGDPIQDMGIGIYTHRDFLSKTEFIDFMLRAIPIILKTKGIPENILHTSGGWLNTKIFKKIQKYLREYCSFKGIPIMSESCEIYYWPASIKDSLIKMGYVHKFVELEK